MVEISEKQCRLCEFIKPISDFYFRKSRNTYYHECKLCCSTKSLNNYKLNKNKRSQQMRQYYQDNRKSLVDKNRQHYTDNRLMVLKRHKEWRDEFRSTYGTSYNNFRYRNNINHKISCNLRSRLYDAVNNRIKSGSAILDLGCSIDELKKHLESKFLPGMTWKNHTVDGWHIDHIRPLDSFDLSNFEEFKKACHYTNLQPLWAKDNWYKNRQQIT
jgi:hypothetical protein